MKFKTDRIRREWESMDLPDKLRRIVVSIEQFMLAKYSYEITVTQILRTQEEQDNIYGDRENYQVNPWKSVHQFFRGIDIRNRDMTPQMIEDVLMLANQIIYDDKRPHKQTAKSHDVGKGDHIHLQVMP